MRSRSHIKVKVKSSSHQIEVIFKERYSYTGGLHLNQMRSCLNNYFETQRRDHRHGVGSYFKILSPVVLLITIITAVPEYNSYLLTL